MTDEVSVTRAEFVKRAEEQPVLGMMFRAMEAVDPIAWAHTRNGMLENSEADPKLVQLLDRLDLEWGERVQPLITTLLTLVGLTREYLPPDGISKDEFINRVLGVLDNDEMAELVGELEGRK